MASLPVNAFTYFWPQANDTQPRLLWKIASMLFVGLGLSGVDVVTDTSAHTGKWMILHAVTDVVIGSVTYESGLSSGSLAGQTIKAGDRIYGSLTAVTLTSGTAELYRASV